MSIFSRPARPATQAGSSLRMRPIQVAVFFTSWSIWTLAVMMLFALPFTVAPIAQYLHVEASTIMAANSASLLSRTLGAIVFGVASDQYGRKIPMLLNLLMLAVMTLSTGFITTYPQLVVCRLFFGIAIGGTYTLAMTASMDASTRATRGIASGITGEGAAASGQILVSTFHLAMAPHGWRSLYWLIAGLTAVPFVIRLIMPSYSAKEAATLIDETVGPSAVAAVGANLSVWKKVKFIVRRHPWIFCYAVFYSAAALTRGHGAQDLYPTMLTTQKNLSVKQETYVTTITPCGTLIGAIVGGYLGNRYSVKWVPFFSCLLTAAFIPLYLLPSSWKLLALGGFFMDVGFGGAQGNMGNIYQQLCPHPGLRGAFTGVVYNLGTAISSAAPTVETKLGEIWKTADGKPDFERTQLIFISVCTFLMIVAIGFMPLDSMNPDWDLEDPNAEIPQRDLSNNDNSGGSAIEGPVDEKNPAGDEEKGDISQVYIGPTDKSVV